MFKFVTIYRQVDDPDALETFFSRTHLPLAEQLPGLIKSEVSRIMGKPAGQSRFHLAYELYFESRTAFEDALKSKPGGRLMYNITPWAEARLLTWFFAESFEEDAGLSVGDEEE